MTLDEIAQLVCDKVGTTDAESVSIAKRFLTRRHKVIWDSQLWRESLTSLSQAAAIGFRFVVFRDHPEVDRVIAVCTDDDRLISPEELMSLWQINPGAFASTGGVNGVFTPVRRTPLWQGPDALSQYVDFGLQTRSSTLLSPVTVTLTGRDFDGNTRSASSDLTSSGVWNGFGVSFSEVWRMETDISDYSSDGGFIDIAATDDLTDIFGLFYDRGSLVAPTFPVIRLGEVPTVANVVKAIGKLAVPAFTSDDDTPGLQAMDDALIAFVEGDMLSRQRQRGKAALCYQEAAAHVKSMIQQERNQTASIPRIIPCVEPFGLNSLHLGPNKEFF